MAFCDGCYLELWHLSRALLKLAEFYSACQLDGTLLKIPQNGKYPCEYYASQNLAFDEVIKWQRKYIEGDFFFQYWIINAKGLGMDEAEDCVPIGGCLDS